MRKITAQSRHGFTLIEVLVVAVIIVLMLGMALPLFRAITGSRSEAGAANHVAAMLGRARSDAIGLQKIIGVAFLLNNSTQVQSMAEVEFPDCTGWSPQISYVPGNCVTFSSGNKSKYYLCVRTQPVGAGANFIDIAAMYWQNVGGPPLEMRQDTDLLPLPTGIGIQTVCNCDVTTTATPTRTSDGYLNVGVILFDGQGRIVSQNYGISQVSKLGIAAKLTTDYPAVLNPGVYNNNDFGVPSQFGLVVYQREAFTNQNFKGIDTIYNEPGGTSTSTITTDYTANQKAEEDWLDLNSTPLVLNRYTGTLIRAE